MPPVKMAMPIANITIGSPHCITIFIWSGEPSGLEFPSLNVPIAAPVAALVIYFLYWKLKGMAIHTPTGLPC